MNLDEREYIATVINYFWGTGTATPATVNEEAAKVVYDALGEARSCSASMDLVPRLSSGKAGISYIVKQIAKIGKRIAEGDAGLYEVCRVQVARNYKSAIQFALMGL